LGRLFENNFTSQIPTLIDIPQNFVCKEFMKNIFLFLAFFGVFPLLPRDVIAEEACKTLFETADRPLLIEAIKNNLVAHERSIRANDDLKAAQSAFSGDWLKGDFAKNSFKSPYAELLSRFLQFKRRILFKDAPLHPLKVELFARDDTARHSGLSPGFTWDLSQFGGDAVERFVVQNHYKKRSVYHSLQDEYRLTKVKEADPTKMKTWLNSIQEDLANIRSQNLKQALKLATEVDEADFATRTIAPGSPGYSVFNRNGRSIFPDTKADATAKIVPNAFDQTLFGIKTYSEKQAPNGLQEFSAKPKNLTRSALRDFWRAKIWPYYSPKADRTPSVNPAESADTLTVLTLKPEDGSTLEISLESVYFYLRSIRDELEGDPLHRNIRDQLNLLLAFESDLKSEMAFIESISGPLLKPERFEEALRAQFTSERERIQTSHTAGTSPLDRLRKVGAGEPGDLLAGLEWKGKDAEVVLKNSRKRNAKIENRLARIPSLKRASILKGAAIAAALAITPLAQYIPKELYFQTLRETTTKVLGSNAQEKRSHGKIPSSARSVADPDNIVKPSGSGSDPLPYFAVLKMRSETDTIPKNLDVVTSAGTLRPESLERVAHFRARENDESISVMNDQTPGDIAVFAGEVFADRSLAAVKIDENEMFPVFTPHGYSLYKMVVWYQDDYGFEDTGVTAYRNPDSDAYLAKPDFVAPGILYSYVAYFVPNDDLIADRALQKNPKFILTDWDRLHEITQSLKKAGLNQVSQHLSVSLEFFRAEGRYPTVDDIAYILTYTGLYDLEARSKRPTSPNGGPLIERTFKESAYASFKKYLNGDILEYYCEPSNWLIQLILRDYYRDDPTVVIDGVSSLVTKRAATNFRPKLDLKETKPIGHYRTRLRIMGLPGRHMIDSTPVIEKKKGDEPKPKEKEKIKNPIKKREKEKPQMPAEVRRPRIRFIDDESPANLEGGDPSETDERKARSEEIERRLKLLRVNESFQDLVRSGKRAQIPQQIYRVANALLKFSLEQTNIEELLSELSGIYPNLRAQTVGDSVSLRHELKLILDSEFADWKSVRAKHDNRIKAPYPWVFDADLEDQCRTLLEYLASKNWID
jgi:hypothetical protein